MSLTAEQVSHISESQSRCWINKSRYLTSLANWDTKETIARQSRQCWLCGDDASTRCSLWNAAAHFTQPICVVSERAKRNWIIQLDHCSWLKAGFGIVLMCCPRCWYAFWSLPCYRNRNVSTFVKGRCRNWNLFTAELRCCDWLFIYFDDFVASNSNPPKTHRTEMKWFMGISRVTTLSPYHMPPSSTLMKLFW